MDEQDLPLPRMMNEQDVPGWVVNDIVWPVSDIGLSFDSSHELSVCTYFLQLEWASERIWLSYERWSDRERLSSRDVSSISSEIRPESEQEPGKQEQPVQTEKVPTTRERELVRQASDSDILQPQPTDILLTHASDPHIMVLPSDRRRFQYSSTAPTSTEEMPDLRTTPDMSESPESIRHARYQARPGKCTHNSVLRYWINEEHPERVCDICNGTGRFLWSCTADTPDWTDARPRAASSAPDGPAAASSAASESALGVFSFLSPAANEPVPTAPSPTALAHAALAPSGLPPGSAPSDDTTGESSLCGFSFFNLAASGPPPSGPATLGLATDVSSLGGFAIFDSAASGPEPAAPAAAAAAGPAPTSPDTNTGAPDTSILAEWMQKAITKGEYTPAQVQKLVNQKLQVLECAARDRAVQTERAAEAARAAQSSTRGDEATVRKWLARQTDRESHPDDNVPEDPWNGSPCRAVFCILCHWEFTERSIGHIDQVANEPYVAPPNIPEYLNRPISDANILRAMRPQHWVRRHAFGLWWQENRYSSGHDMSPMLRHALNGGWTEEQFKHTAWWVYWQRRSDRDVHGRVRWLEARNLDQISSFSQSIADSRLVIPRSSERQGSHLSMSLDPVLSISRHPIWEECESQEGLLVLPGWEYSLEHRWQALGRLEHRKLTLRFIEQRDALASQSSPS